MSSGHIPATLQRLWGAWNIRGFMILAVVVQLLLAFLSPLRRRTSNPFPISMVWCTYLLTDWTAVFAFGLITNSGCRSQPGQPSSQVSAEYLTLWAALLLVHLGGPDSITAFSLEDNALWPRHLVGLVSQISGFFYILWKTMSGGKNALMAPTMLVFVAGVINYGERSRSLYLASLERMKRSWAKLLPLDTSPMHPSWRIAYSLSQMLKALVVDVTPDDAELQVSREFFLNVEDAEAALDVLTKEMSFLYDMLYTKTLALRSRWGLNSRVVFYASICVGSMWFYFLKKHEQHEIDYKITMLLLCEVFVFQTISLFMLVLPLWNPQIQWKWELRSEAMGSFNLLAYCFKESTRGKGRDAFGSIARMIGVADMIVGCKYVSKIPFDVRLWKFVFDQLKAPLVTNVDVAREIYEARGDLALGRANCHDLMRFIKGFEFDSTLLTWHVATLICYHIDEAFSVDETDNREFSETASCYMVYLMVKQPKLMSPVIGIGYDRYIDTCEEMKCRGRSFRPTDMKDFCVKLLAQDGVDGEPGDGGRSVLINSCDLARMLLTKDRKWKIISEVWVELLSYAAGHCRAESYARLLAEGGEFISFVWLLMAHLGIGPRVPVE